MITNKVRPACDKRIGFSGQLLYKVNIKKVDIAGITSIIPAKIIKLIPEDKDDVKAFKTICRECIRVEVFIDWLEKQIINKKSIGVVLQIEEPLTKLKNKILSFAQIKDENICREEGENSIEVINIFTQPSTRHEYPYREYQGAGEVLMYGIGRIAKDAEKEKIMLSSNNDAFYRAIKMPKTPDFGNDCHSFDKNSLNEFLKRVEEKYQFSPHTITP